MSTTDMTHTELAEGAATAAAAPVPDSSIWGAPPPAAAPMSPATGETFDAAPPARRWLPAVVKTKFAALLAAAGLVVGGAAGVAVGPGTSSGSTTPAGQFGGGQGGQGGPGGGFGGPGGARAGGTTT